MFLSNAMMDWAGPRDPHPGLPGLWGGNMGHYYDEQMYSVFWGWGRERLISCGQVFWKGERGEDWAEVGGLIATQGHSDVWAWADAGAHV